MRTITVALGSFTLGALSVFLASSGNQMSIVGQPLFAAQAQTASDAPFSIDFGEEFVPKVPAFSTNRLEDNRQSGGKYRMDGFNCTRCGFMNVTFVYGGGSYGFTNCAFGGNFTLELTGAAANTLRAINFFTQLAKSRQSPPVPPQPKLRLALGDSPITVTLVSEQSNSK